MDALLKDLGYALRSLRAHPAFALTAVLTLALGIGATTAIFSVVDAVLLRPLPYAQAQQLVLIWGDMRARHVTDFPFSPPDLKDLREQTSSFKDIAGLFSFRNGLTVKDEAPEQVRALGVTPNLLSVLGERVLHGRDFNDGDGFAPPAPPPPAPGAPPPPAATPPPPPLPAMLILNYAYWQRRFGGDTSVIGKAVDFGGGPATIIGVLPPGFEVLFPPNTNMDPNPDVVVANRVDVGTASRINVFLRLVGRLKPGVSLAAARNDVERLAGTQRDKYQIMKAADTHYRVEDMHDNLVAEVRPVILALMGAVLFVLLIACANVANLLLVRASARERELSIRAALGSSPGRLIRQLLAESFVLAAIGAVAGLALAFAGIKLLIALAPTNLPRLDDVGMDPFVLGFAIVAALVAATIFGVFPALRASRPDLAEVLRASGRSPNLGGGKFLRNGVVMAEVALSFVLLVGGGLMVRSFIALAKTDPGFDPKGLLTFSIGGRGGRSRDQRIAFVDQLRAKLAAIPGVVAVTSATPIPLDGTLFNSRWGTEEAAKDPSKFQQANLHIVLPGYFEAMHTKLIAGRTFTEDDNRQEFLGVIIDNILAAKAFPGQNAVGQRIYARTRGQTPEWLNVIGVVAHERHETLITEGREAMFLPERFFGPGSTGRWAVRINCPPNKKCDPTTVGPAVRKVVADLDPLVPVAEMTPMSEIVDRAMSGTRFALVLIGVFAGVAAVLACVGMYGVLSTAVRQRTAEIGVRMTYGATSGSIFGLVIGDGMKLSAFGLAIGLVAALALTRVMRSMLVGVQPTDPLTYGAILVLFLAITALACWIPARRAAGLDPANALRSE